MVNYLERARALVECSPLPSSFNVSPIQQRKPERFSKVNFIVNQQRDNTVGYEQVENITEENSYCMKHKMRFINASAQLSQYRCCCSLMHAVTGTRFFLLTYMALSVITFTFATKSAVLWSVVPFVIASLSIYALCTEKHKYLYPFLVISSVHIILCIMVVLIIITFTAASYGTFRQIVGYYIKIRLNDTLIVIFVITTVILFLTLSIVHLWQVTVVYSCMMYFEQKRYLESDQYHPIISKYNCSHAKEDGHFDSYHKRFATNHKCYDSCASV
ncbi:unnamed protein product [Cercopithifilaria johnstoni]|uniref:Uncharacterized protein n=1 Tax=Cercopithifilaria johnstoni TaxID=2874296 RepID=A0A8J2M140_9BILA|nr:unnamed protein product [Cercopithifilaria johnstoni]